MMRARELEQDLSSARYRAHIAVGREAQLQKLSAYEDFGGRIGSIHNVYPFLSTFDAPLTPLMPVHIHGQSPLLMRLFPRLWAWKVSSHTGFLRILTNPHASLVA